jgi:hypothetical protein
MEYLNLIQTSTSRSVYVFYTKQQTSPEIKLCEAKSLNAGEI